MKKFNLVFLVTLDHPVKIGGGQYSIYKIAENSAKLHSVKVFYVNNKKIISNYSNCKNIELYKKIHFGRNFLNLFIEKIYDKILLERVFRNEKIDFIIGSQKKTAIKAAKLGKKYNVKIVNFVFETPEWLKEMYPEWENIWYNNKKLRDDWHKFKNALLNSDYVIANSKITAKKAEKWLNRKISGVVYPGFDIINNYIEKNKKENQIIYVGRLEKHKNVDLIIKALSKINFNIKFIIIGNGNELEGLKRLALEKEVNAIFLGNVSDRDKWRELKKSLFMVFPSSFEGFGMPPMEALAVGIPCIAGDIPILREVYGNKLIYIRVNNENDLVKEVKRLLFDIQYREKLGKEGQQYVMKNFCWDKSVKSFISILQGL